MPATKQLGGIDRFRLVAAFLVVAIHTSPLLSINEQADFVLTRIICRVAVPFFFMVTGQFVVSPALNSGPSGFSAVWRSVKKLLIYYFAAILIYLPVNIYSGGLPQGIQGIVKSVLIEGTFYHLWYFPAVITGVLIVWLLSSKLSFKALLIITLVLYAVGLGGDSYYGLAQQVPVLDAFYNMVFSVFSYTRNGLFYAPVFIVLGAWVGQNKQRIKPGLCIAGFAASALLMLVEGMALHQAGVQHHDSMYISLVPCMCFLYQIISGWNAKPSDLLRPVSTIIYIIHPMVIIAVRGFAKLTGQFNIMVKNSVVHYILVSIGSLVAGLAVAVLVSACKRKNNYSTGRAWVEISRANLAHNLQTLNAILPEGCRLMPAVKANAYGHGLVQVSKELSRLGVKHYCVACVQEGVELRQNGIRGLILVLGYTHPEDFLLLHRYRLTQTVVSYDYAMCISSFSKPFDVHIKIDTGMNRLGLKYDNTDEILKVFTMPGLRIKGVFTHLCSADMGGPEEKAKAHEQFNAFKTTLDFLDKQGVNYGEVHILSSEGLVHCPEFGGVYARTGIALYGGMKNPGIGLKPVLSLKARVAVVKDIAKGETVGYGMAFKAGQDMRIAIITIGYGDGLPRTLSCGKVRVLIAGGLAPVIGYVCMDQTMVDITDIPNVKSGDEVVVIGSSGSQEIPVWQMAEDAATIPNDILSGLSSRLVRIIIG